MPSSIAGLAQSICIVSVILLVYPYVLYPALLGLVALFRRRKLPQSGYCPRLSVLIAAYNEEANIGRKLEETLALDYPPDRFEILVVSDGSTDRTDEIVRAMENDRIRLLPIARRGGKTHAQNEGVRHCNGEVIVFSDATARYHPQALRRLASHYQDPHVGAVSGRYQYFDPGGRSPTGLGSVAFWSYENIVKALQSRISTLTGCSGCIYSVRKGVYTPLPDSACSDLVEPLCVVRKGYRVAFESRALAYEETTQSAGEEFGMRVRVATRGMRGVLSVRDLLKFWRHAWVAYQLLSHKIMRWLAPLWLIVLFVANAAVAHTPPYTYLFAAQCLFYGVAALSLRVPLHRKWKILGIPLFFVTLNAAVLCGMVELIRGRKYVVWETVRN